ncbi:hypothetical protein [Alkalinema sp. FACHB-956]|uniref:hypothetical protein n=1 Tax=Alkalinema sp. FACHB-956 TaxID=2692768 RepID=UPI001684A88C|nr:hypothetical protein [Alkalinema sp. FACHB-956]MBD2325808.1 hypothetical protein [Alkalinema sp. FACHB-956]
MQSSTPAALPFRRRPEPVQFWLAVFCGSLVLHSGLLLGVRRWGADVLAGGGAGDSIAVELVDAPTQPTTQSDFVAPKGNPEQPRSGSSVASPPPETASNPEPQVSQPSSEASVDSVDPKQPKEEKPITPQTSQSKPPNSTKKTQDPKTPATQKPNPQRPNSKPSTAKPAGEQPKGGKPNGKPSSGDPKIPATGDSPGGGKNNGDGPPNVPKGQFEVAVGTAGLAPKSGNDPSLGNPGLKILQIQQGTEIVLAPTIQRGQTLPTIVKVEVSPIQGGQPGSIVSVEVQPESPAIQSGILGQEALQDLAEKVLKGATCEVISDPNATYSPANKPSTIWLVTVNLKVL